LLVSSNVYLCLHVIDNSVNYIMLHVGTTCGVLIVNCAKIVFLFVVHMMGSRRLFRCSRFLLYWRWHTDNLMTLRQQ